MTATRQDIEYWLNVAKIKDSSHLIIAVDKFDYENYPVYIKKDQLIEKEIRHIQSQSMQGIDEIYNMSMDINQQLNQQRAWNIQTERNNEMQVYTSMPTPFSFGGISTFIKTTIEEYERISIGAGYYGLLFKNPHKELWHMAQEDCGALIGSDKSKEDLIQKVKDDVANGDPKIMKTQIEMGRKQLEQAKLYSNDEWFSNFRE